MRRKSPSLRGSVTQNRSSVRVSASDSRLTLMMRLGIIGAALLAAALLVLWGWHSGWFHRQASQVANDGLHLTQKAHFAVADIVVEGRQHTDKDQLFVALEAPAGSPIFAFNPAQAEARIVKLPWVESVTVERRLPDTIFVRLVERLPLARWQRDNRLTVIDTQGKVLQDTNPDQFAQLPLLVGTGAPAEAKKLLDDLRVYPTVQQQVSAAVRVGERRWDLHLQPKIVARMPETDLANALKRLSILIADQKILERDIVAIDLRLPDRLIIESGNTTTQQHPASGENRL